MSRQQNNHNPTLLEILLTKIAFRFYGKSVYQDFANRLALVGSEQVLDFGCGMGNVAFYTAKKLTIGTLTCLDISNRWLKSCKKKLSIYPNIVYVHSKTQVPVLKSNFFDVVYCHFVLHDIDEASLKDVFLSLISSMKKGGSLVFREPLSSDKKLQMLKKLAGQNGLSCETSRITDFPLMGNCMESYYVKFNGG